MADNVQWIKMKVGMFDGDSFKKIKRAKIGGVPFRDKLTAIWFELLDLAGKSNHNGMLMDGNEIPYHTFEDIACMLDRDEKEIELCMQFFLSERMIEIIDDIYCLSNFEKYQCIEGLEKIREQKRIAQANWRAKKKSLIPQVENVSVDTTVDTTNNLPSISISNSLNNSISNNIISIEEITTYFDKTWDIYPRKVSKVRAKEYYINKIVGLEKEEARKVANSIYLGLVKQIKWWKEENNGDGRPIDKTPHFGTWLNENIEDSPFKGKKRK